MSRSASEELDPPDVRARYHPADPFQIVTSRPKSTIRAKPRDLRPGVNYPKFQWTHESGGEPRVPPQAAVRSPARRPEAVRLTFLLEKRAVDWIEAFRCTASRGGTWRAGLLLCLFLLSACVGAAPEPDRAVVHSAESPDGREQYCAWFGDSDGEVLYFGQSAFWSAHRASGGRAAADLDLAGPASIGRFDLAAERLLTPLEVGGPADRSGVWDVLAHPNGRVYFTTYFASAGWVDPASGEVKRFETAGNGLNELALGADGSILASRYGAPGDSNLRGGVAVLDPDGNLLAEFALHPPPGFAAAPKTVAWDRVREQIWVTTDLLPEATDPPREARHDTWVLDRHGNELRRIEHPEIQFVAFAPDGTGYQAEVEGRELWLRLVPPTDRNQSEHGRRVPLDREFAADLDFVQDVQFSSEGVAVVTRWSGWVHLVGDDGAVRSLRLPPSGSDGIYYTAALHGDRVCATLCRNVNVVCRSVIPEPASRERIRRK